MENASKMLIMAATILISLMIISVFIYLFRLGASVNENYDERQSEGQLELYNNKFQYYNVENNTIMDMITIANLAYSVNKDTNYDSGWAIAIDIKIGSSTFKILDTEDESDPLKRNEIYSGSNKISIYNLVDLPIGSGGLNLSGVPSVEEGDKLSTTRYDSSTNKTIYKYLFKCNTDKIKYNSVTGRTSYMSFELYLNSEY